MKRDDIQVESALARINKLEDIFEKLISNFSPKYKGAIQKPQIFESLFLLLSEKYELEWSGDLWDIEIEYEETQELLSNFNFESILNKIETPKEIISQHLIRDLKGWIKSKNITWVIHKSDIDPFPSNPHAHQLDNNIKLDLSNGNCYRVRKYVHTIKKKELLIIRAEASKIFKGDLPPLKI